MQSKNERQIEMSNQQQQEAESERYAACLEAITECVGKGVGIDSIRVLLFEMGINLMDCASILENQIFKLKKELYERIVNERV